MRYIGLLLTASCAYISGPPDFSGVPPLTDVQLRAAATGVEITLTPNPDLPTPEGQLRVSISGEEEIRPVPAEIPGWASGAQATLSIPHTWDCNGETITVEVALTDASGREAAPVITSFTLNGAGTFLGGAFIPLGAITFPFVACGDLPNPDDAFDELGFDILSGEGGLFRAELIWTGVSDLDLQIRDDDNVLLSQDNTSGSLQPAIVQQELIGGATFNVRPVHYEGPDTLWTLVMMRL